uniref:Protein kinase C and casein kinase substrate in neurons 2 n=1 Tax=Pseudonaja textilis TaxID=8673 RepID=A0A670YCW6_PSETE
MSGSYEDSVEVFSGSFWEVGNYKRTVRRIDDGYRLCGDLMNCIHERARIEKAYAQQLTEWAKRWRQLVEKGPQYGTVERAWHAFMSEAEKVSELHLEVKNALMNEDFEKIKNWQKDSFHKQMIGGFKETKEAEDGFRKAQKPWAKKLKEVEASKKAHHTACKEEKIAISREANSKADPALNPEQLKKLQDKIDKSKQDVLKTKEKYEKSLKELDSTTPQYMENMEQVFEQCQQFEEKRLRFFREVLLEVQKHLDLSTDSSVPSNTVQSIQSSYNPFEDEEDSGSTVSEKEDIKIKNVSSYEKNQSLGTEWSDEETNNPFSSNDGQGESNPFDEDVSPTMEVRVRALYDYEGQEHDELSFKIGEELTKIEDEDEQGWCKGRLDNGKVGLYPANYVEPIQ